MVGSWLGGAQAEGQWRERGGRVGENIKGVGGDRACLWQNPMFWFPGAERRDDAFSFC